MVYKNFGTHFISFHFVFSIIATSSFLFYQHYVPSVKIVRHQTCVVWCVLYFQLFGRIKPISLITSFGFLFFTVSTFVCSCKTLLTTAHCSCRSAVCKVVSTLLLSQCCMYSCEHIAPVAVLYVQLWAHCSCRSAVCNIVNTLLLSKCCMYSCEHIAPVAVLYVTLSNRVTLPLPHQPQPARYHVCSLHAQSCERLLTCDARYFDG